MVVRLEIKRNDGQYTYGDYLAEVYHGIAPAIILIHKISDMVGYTYISGWWFGTSLWLETYQPW